MYLFPWPQPQLAAVRRVSVLREEIRGESRHNLYGYEVPEETSLSYTRMLSNNYYEFATLLLE